MSSRNRFFECYQGQTDEHGFNVTTYKNIEPFVRFLFRRWFGVKIANIENIPPEGRAVVFGNHSGGLPVDGALLYDGVINEHSSPRPVRYLVTKFLLSTPVVGKILRGYGCVPPKFETAVELLEDGHMVFFYPEAEKGTGKLFKNRYRLVDFHNGFVRAALKTQSPVVPVVTIGSEEIYPIFANIKPIARLLKWPYFPLSTGFPWLPFPFYATPLPSKILICVFPAFELKYAAEAADDEELVAQIVQDIRSDLQVKVDDLLSLRKSVFGKWDMTEVKNYLTSERANLWVSGRHRRDS